MLYTDCFFDFGKCLDKAEPELTKIWDEVLGRYDKAILALVVDVLGEAEDPVEEMSNALKDMKSPQSAIRAAESIQRGQFFSCALVFTGHMQNNAHDIISLPYSSALGGMPHYFVKEHS